MGEQGGGIIGCCSYFKAKSETALARVGTPLRCCSGAIGRMYPAKGLGREYANIN